MSAEHRASLDAVETGAQDAGPMVRLIPVSEGSAVRMAALVKEFSPCHFTGPADSDFDFAGAPLHPSWVSGLVAAGVESALPGCFVRHLAIVHKRQVYRKESLGVETVCVKDFAETRVCSVSFRVLSTGLEVAEGTALVEAPSRQESQ
jgi:hypothetical protein